MAVKYYLKHALAPLYFLSVCFLSKSKEKPAFLSEKKPEKVLL